MNNKTMDNILLQIDSAILSVEAYVTENNEDKKLAQYLEWMKKSCPQQMGALDFAVQLGACSQEELDNIIKERVLQYINEADTVKAVRDKGYSWYSNKTNGTWSHYSKFLNSKGFKDEDIEEIDKSTTRILCSVENPRIASKFSQKGLVIGNIQSGKTANFTGLMSKFIDSKVDYIVVFTGIHNTLRNQTQIRIENDLIGRTQDQNGVYSNVGIGTMVPDYHSNAVMITNTFDDLKASDNRDLENEGNETTKIFIVKKNVSTLKTLYKMLSSVADKNKSILIIDDEADNASIDTNANKDDKTETATNASIRSLIQLFDRSFYIAYTATPYANIFIDKETTSEELDDDLFPRDFILKLEVSENYTGYEKYFNTAYSKQLVTKIDENIEFDKFEDALIDFMMAAALKKYMYEDNEKYSWFKHKHATMMIHNSHLVAEHHNQKFHIKELFKTISGKILYFQDTDLKKLLQVSFDNARSAHIKITGEQFELNFEVVFEKLKEMLNKNEFSFNVNNSTTEEKLVYGSEFKTCIVIGGNTLSRGLTLEGLLVSYFGRVSNTMDTMSQMARWFGYRGDYLFMTKVYIPQIGEDYFNKIAKVDKLINEQLIEMHEYNQTPSEFTWMISKFGSLNPTSTAKQGGATRKAFSFSGSGPQITGFDVDKFEENKKLIDKTISNLDIEILDDGYKANNVSSQNLIEFLSEYKVINDDSRLYSASTDVKSWADYIVEKNNLVKPELTNWTIVLKGKQQNENIEEFSFGELNFVNRKTQDVDTSEKNLRRAKIISAPLDESLDLNEKLENRKLSRETRNPENGLLIIYGVNDAQLDTNQKDLLLR